MRLNQKQAEFIKKEFGVELESNTEIKLDDNIRWEIHDKAFWIEAAELPDEDGSLWSDRCRLAVEVCDLMYEG